MRFLLDTHTFIAQKYNLNNPIPPMTKLTIEVPDPLLEQLALAGHSLAEILPDAVRQYLANRSEVKPMTQTQTWALCGTLTLAQHESVDSGVEAMPEMSTTNEAEQIDELLYNGL
jgi:hypothetical protein